MITPMPAPRPTLLNCAAWGPTPYALRVRAGGGSWRSASGFGGSSQLARPPHARSPARSGRPVGSPSRSVARLARLACSLGHLSRSFAGPSRAGRLALPPGRSLGRSCGRAVVRTAGRPLSPVPSHLRCNNGAASRVSMCARALLAAHRQRTEGRAGRAHLLLARSLDAVEDTPEGAEVRPGSPRDPDRTSARCCPLLPTLPSSPATLYNPRSSSARRSEEEARPLLDLLGPPCRLWAAWASTVEHPAMCGMKFFFLAERSIVRQQNGVGTTRARSCAERSGRTQRGTIAPRISS